ncbi:MAG TPA: PD-(D/E)XK nuclease family protein [Chthoniobacteraceae bacterium]|nr:PD-(D/E)XK nuclease family protein [Chthoniobacteraceae bacterium]
MSNLLPIERALAHLDALPLDYDLAKARALIVGYDLRWRGKYAGYAVISVEEEFRFPLLNPQTEGMSKTFDEGGKIDAVLQHRASDRYLVLEHKTTSESVAPDSDYWHRLAMDTQSSKYILALKQRGLDVGNLLHDVIKKPGSRPRQIPTLDSDGVKIVLDANGERVRTKDGKKWRESASPADGYVLQSQTETPEEYGARLEEEITGDLDAYFAQREVPRLDADLLEYMGDAWAQSQQILHYRRGNLWPRNPSACSMFGQCEFYELCTGRASVDGIRYRQKARKHSELEMEEGEKELLTNSRLTALRKCARYHYHRYENPIEPTKEESEALRFGTLMHKAFEIYFRSMMID